MHDESCPVCTGDEEALEPCSEECWETIRRAEIERVRKLAIAGFRQAITTALLLAHRYRQEEGPGGRRERDTIASVKSYRRAIHQLRASA